VLYWARVAVGGQRPLLESENIDYLGKNRGLSNVPADQSKTAIGFFVPPYQGDN
jgi:hypothetical protein